MTTPSFDSTSSTRKAPFFFADGLILTVALFIGWTGSSPLGTVEKTGIAACVIFAGVITAAPFVIDFKRRKERPSAVAVPSAAPEPVAKPSEEPPAWVGTFASLQARIDTLETNLAGALTTNIAGLRLMLDEHRAGESQARDALREEIRQAIASSQETTAAHIDALLAAARTASADQQEAVRHSLDEAISAVRQERSASDDRLLARMDERLNTALTTWETRIIAAMRAHVAEELAEEKAAAARRSVAAPTLVLEASPVASPSGKSRLGRGLESLITSPQAKPSIAESPEPQLPLPTPTPATTPVIFAENIAPAPQEITPLAPAIPEAATPVSAVSTVAEKPTPRPEASRTKREPVIAVLDPFHIPANGYADLAQAMDASYDEAHSREFR